MLTVAAPAFIKTLGPNPGALIIDLLDEITGGTPPMAWAVRAGLDAWRPADASKPAFCDATLLWLGLMTLNKICGLTHPFCPQSLPWHAAIYHLLLATLKPVKMPTISQWAAATVVRALGLAGGAMRGAPMTALRPASAVASAVFGGEVTDGDDAKTASDDDDDEDDDEDEDDGDDDGDDDDDDGPPTKKRK